MGSGLSMTNKVAPIKHEIPMTMPRNAPRGIPNLEWGSYSFSFGASTSGSLKFSWNASWAILAWFGSSPLISDWYRLHASGVDECWIFRWYLLINDAFSEFSRFELGGGGCWLPSDEEQNRLCCWWWWWWRVLTVDWSRIYGRWWLQCWYEEINGDWRYNWLYCWRHFIVYSEYSSRFGCHVHLMSLTAKIVILTICSS